MTSVRGAEIGPGSRAVGRIPSGLFVLSRTDKCGSTGLLVSWVQQAGFNPLTLTVALRADRSIASDLKVGERFVLNQIGEGQTTLLKRFARPSTSGQHDFHGLPLIEGEAFSNWAGPVLAEAIACLHGQVIDRMGYGDHVILLVQILDGVVNDAHAAPQIHIRKSGSHY